MFDYKELIFEFVKQNFTPAYPDLANVKFTTEEFLDFLFRSFPYECINDYELNEILIALNFERYTYSDENYNLAFGWCMHSDKIPMP